jgi:cytochrome c553
MQDRIARLKFPPLLTLCLTAVICLGVTNLSAQPAPGSPTISPLIWDSSSKEAFPAPGQPSADFVFKVNNPTGSEIDIQNVTTTCGCTVAKIPSRPWPLAAHTNDSMTISVNLTAKTGTFSKGITVWSQGYQNQILTVRVHMPDSTEALRQRNMQLAVTDRQAIFKDPNCVKCHLDPLAGKMGRELFAAACEICHNPTGPGESRASMVPDLRALNHSTDYNYWKAMIIVGKPGTLMPAFGSVAGGPLTDEQVDSLAKTLAALIPSSPQTNVMNGSQLEIK